MHFMQPKLIRTRNQFITMHFFNIFAKSIKNLKKVRFFEVFEPKEIPFLP